MVIQLIPEIGLEVLSFQKVRGVGRVAGPGTTLKGDVK